MNGQAQIAPVGAFGWKFHHVKAQAGTWFDIAVGRMCTVAEMGVYAFHTAGLVTCTNIVTGISRQPRTPGVLTIGLPPMDPGIYRYVAQQPSEWWCIDRKFNGGQLPPVRALSLAVGQSHDGMVVVCSGPDAGKSFTGYTAAQDCLALEVSSEGAAESRL